MKFSALATRGARSLLALLGAGFLGMGAGRAASPAEEAPLTVTIFSLPNPSNTNPGNLAAYEVVKRFHELHSDIRLQSATALQIEGIGMDAAPLMSIAGGTSPDIIYVNFRQSDTYIREGFLYPLDEYIRELTPEELDRRIPASIRPVVFREGPDGGKHYWAMPEDVLVTVLLYRKDLFAQAGLDPSRAPRDWQEMRRYAEALTDPGRGRYGFSLPTGPMGAWGILPFLSSAGSHAVVQDPDGTWRAAFDTSESVEGYRYAAELMKASVTKNGRTAPLVYRGADFHTVNAEGRVGMYFGYLGGREVAKFNPDVVAAAPVPAGPGGISSAEVNAQMLGIFAGVKDKRVRDAAWKYLKFVGSREAREVYTRAMVELGAAHLLNPLWLEEFGYTELARLAPPGLVDAYRFALKNGTPEPYGRNCQFVYNYMSRPLDRLFYTDFENLPRAEGDALIHRILVEAVKETNERMLGQLPPEERTRRNIVSWIVAVVVMVVFVTFIRLVFRWMAQGMPKVSATANRQRGKLAIAFLLPALLLILAWQYYPLLRGSLMAFQDYKIMGGSPWVGISNFADILYDKRFWHSLLNAFWFCALWMVLGFLPPVALAIILQEIPMGKMTFRVLFYIPAVVSGVVILFMWRGFYDPSPDGLLNRAIGLLGIPSQAWLQDPRLAMFCVVFPLAWAHLGPGCIIYLAALKGIPDELYEASDIDGAGFFRKIGSIVIPYLKPLLVINAVGATIYGFKSADAVLAMTGGGPDGATQVVGYEIWQRSFLFLKFGQATAMAWVLALILLVFTAYQMRVLARVEFRTAR
jgi:ABC-type sugar transport system permease subunit/ABC-type glycerol-3-phosphate transport system substrate-binding protein